MRWATLVVLSTLSFGVGCNDLRDFRGTWTGDRVGDVEALRKGPGDRASLTIEEIDAHGLVGLLAVDGLAPETSIRSIDGAEADVLANMTFAGAPLRVYLSFVPIPDGRGDAFVLVALYDDRRIEVRILRAGVLPLYAIFALRDGG